MMSACFSRPKMALNIMMPITAITEKAQQPLKLGTTRVIDFKIVEGIGIYNPFMPKRFCANKATRQLKLKESRKFVDYF